MHAATVSRDAARTLDRPVAATPAVRVVAWLTAAWCLGFTVPNIVYEATDHFVDGPFAEYAATFTVMNWLVLCLKVLGAGIALLSVSRGPRTHARRVLLGVALWGAFATLAVYNLGSVVEAVGMATGLAGSPADIDFAGLGYLLLFALGAAGFGVVAVSYARRHRLRWHLAVVGALGAPLFLGLVLVAVPALLTALGVMPE